MATFEPQRRETLRLDEGNNIGRRLQFLFGWRMTEEDSGVYAGQVAWAPRDHSMGWVPTEDLVDVDVLRLRYNPRATPGAHE